jgi:XRE family transcriptional regulator, fatty acid utilization regulator
MPLHDRLRELRERTGLTQAAASERTSIGISSLSEFENGKREPSLSQVQALATCYGVSLAELLTERPGAPDVVLWREKPGAAAGDLEAQFLQLCRQYRNLEVWCAAEAAVSLPAIAPAHGTTFTYEDVAELAKDTRRQLLLGERPARGLLAALEEECGVKVFHLPFEPSGTAACARSDAFGAAILLNAKNVRWRRNFDLAHELFHLLTWSRFDHSHGASSKEEEHFANAFASHLLLPEDAVRTAVHQRVRNGRIAIEGLYEIARDFDVSVEALLWRAKAIYGHTQEATQRAVDRAKTYARAYEERSGEVPPIRPARFHGLAVTALRKGEISQGRFAEYLGISRREAQEYVDQGGDSDEAFELPAA